MIINKIRLINRWMMYIVTGKIKWRDFGKQKWRTFLS